MKKRLLCLTLALLSILPLCAWSVEPQETEPAAEPIAAATEPAQAPTQDIPTEAAPVEAAGPEETPAEETPVPAAPAVPNQFEIYVNGQAVPEAHSLLENGITYVAIDPVTRALFPDAQSAWGGGNTDVEVTGAGFTLSYNAQRPYLICNGRYLYYTNGVRLHPQDSAFLVPVRVLAKALGAQVGWDGAGVYLTSGAPIESGETFYNATDLDLLARVVQHESGNQPLKGKIAVAQVILNRVKAGSRAGFADSVSGVIYQKGQFPGATNATAKSEAIIAAKLAMDGADVVPGAYWFNGVGKSFWASRNKSLLFTIGNHAFYG